MCMTSKLKLHFTSCMIFGAMHAMQPANIMHELFGSHGAMLVCHFIKKCLSAKTRHSTDMTLMELVSALEH